MTVPLAAPIEISAHNILRSRLLGEQEGLLHGVTSRVPGAGLADGNVGYSAPRDRDDAWAMRRAWGEVAGFDATQIAVAYQVHAADVLALGQIDAGRGAVPVSKPVGHADGLMTNEPGVVLMTLHADCMPIILYDPTTHTAATVHAGWRGTVADVAGATVRAMKRTYGSHPSNLLAFLGPAIGGCCYDVGEDVVEAWRRQTSEQFGDAIKRDCERVTFDLEDANRRLLVAAGVNDSAIEASGICTRCNGDFWFSHRGQGALTGRYGAFVALSG